MPAAARAAEQAGAGRGVVRLPVLFGRAGERPAGQDRGHRGIAAEADHHPAPERLEQAPRLAHAEGEH